MFDFETSSFSRLGVVIRSAAMTSGAILLAIACAAGSSASARQVDECAELAHSSLPYVMTLSTSRGKLTLTTHRDGNLIKVDVQTTHGSHYAITRRGGYDLAYDRRDGRTEIKYAGVSTDTPISTAKPARYDTSVTFLRGDKKSETRHFASAVTYVADEVIAVGTCKISVLHFVVNRRSLDGLLSVMKIERWFSPGLNMNLQVIESSKAPGELETQFFVAKATSIRR